MSVDSTPFCSVPPVKHFTKIISLIIHEGLHQRGKCTTRYTCLSCVCILLIKLTMFYKVYTFAFLL